jgi:hypothetical protein
MRAPVVTSCARRGAAARRQQLGRIGSALVSMRRR